VVSRPASLPAALSSINLRATGHLFLLRRASSLPPSFVPSIPLIQLSPTPFPSLLEDDEQHSACQDDISRRKRIFLGSYKPSAFAVSFPFLLVLVVIKPLLLLLNVVVAPERQEARESPEREKVAGRASKGKMA
jgi:hypothetical protein